MPILQYGEYKVQLTGFDSDAVKSPAVTFYCYPYFDLLCCFVFLIFMCLLWNPGLYDESYNRSKYWAVLPMVIGFLVMLLRIETLQYSTLPLIALSLILLTWRWIKPKNWSSASFSAFIICGMLSMIYMVLGDSSWPPLDAYFIIFATGGLGLAYPVIVLRIAIRKGGISKKLANRAFYWFLNSIPGYFFCFNITEIVADIFECAVSSMHESNPACGANPMEPLGTRCCNWKDVS